jgi:hypothetical protein
MEFVMTGGHPCSMLGPGHAAIPDFSEWLYSLWSRINRNTTVKNGVQRLCVLTRDD